MEKKHSLIMWHLDTMASQRLVRNFEKLPRVCRSGTKLLLFLTVLFGTYAIYRTEHADTFFGADRAVCHGDKCSDPGESSQDAKPSNQVQDKLKSNPPENIKVDSESDSVGKSLGSSEVLADGSSMEGEINVIITFTNAEHNKGLQAKLEVTVRSLLEHTSVPLVLHIIGERKSQDIAAQIIAHNSGKAKYRMVNLNVDQLGKELDEVIQPMQKHFSYKPGAYYNHALFFLSIAIHRVMPEMMKKVIMLDADLKFKDDIVKLHQQFDLFREPAVIGIGYDLQPVYRHTFSLYRTQNPGTRVGEAGPDGLQGFNSGVLLLNLEKMRKSKLYNSLLSAEVLQKLTDEFHFKGHLGDQDFFSLISMKHEELFHVLPCTWNRQLCTWWKEHGYRQIFDKYYNCKGEVKIYHGNCNTPIPDD